MGRRSNCFRIELIMCDVWNMLYESTMLSQNFSVSLALLYDCLVYRYNANIDYILVMAQIYRS